MILTTTFDSPVGPLGLAAREDGTLVRIALPDLSAPIDGTPSDHALVAACDALAAYFAGERQDLDLPVAPAGTAFQRRVWDALQAIPYGVTRSYGAVADAIGRPGAARAVGAANRANPIPIVIPCHRVLGADGSLTGYAGLGGLHIKRYLLDLESGAGGLPLGLGDLQSR